VLRLIAPLLAFALAGCAGAPTRARVPAEPGAVPADPSSVAMPVLRLPPRALPAGLALQQRLTFDHGGRRDTLDALVESDAVSTRLLVHAQGQVALRLVWDGTTLDEQRAPWLPATVAGERVLADLQLVFWPVAAIRAALPAGWTIDEAGDRRELRDRGEPVVVVDGAGSGRARLQQRRENYVLEIESQAVAP
jgi:hypothetical protein